MNDLILNGELAWRLAGWTMLHFLWIGALLALAVYVIRLSLRRAAPAVRYAITLVCFVALAAAPVGIAAWLGAHTANTPATADLRQAIARPAPVAHAAFTAEDAPVAKPPATADRRQAAAQIIDLKDTPIVVDQVAAPPLEVTPAIPSTPSLVEDSPWRASEPALESPPPPFDYTALLDRASEVLPWVWIVGAPLTFLLLVSGLVGVERLRRNSTLLKSGPVFEAAERLRCASRLTRKVAVAVSDRVVQPVLIGIVRPLILLPSAAVSGWSPEQLEMALLHELAHVRRWDNLVNLFQRLVESLLFFHPAVWLVSRWLRADREQCCDAIVVRHTGQAESYAELLIHVAATNNGYPLPLAPSSILSSPLSQHPLTRRIRRILELEDDPMLVSRSTFGLIGLALAVAVTLVLWQPTVTSSAQDASRVVPVEDPPGRDRGENAEEGLTTEDTESTEDEASHVVRDPNSPFLPLEQQRIADLAYAMLGVEIAPIDKSLLPQIKAHRFTGGVEITWVVGADGAFANRAAAAGIVQGDILVGLHVWPTGDFDELAEVLRRDDLMEFSPLKYYVLRPTPVEREQAGEMGGFGEFGGGEFGGRGGGRRGGGFGRGGFGGGRPGEFGGDAAAAPPETELKLITGRISIPQESWQAEQQRLQWARQKSASIAPVESPSVPDAELPSGQPPVSPPEAEQDNPANPNLTNLRYDGRTFDQWRSQWKTELKTEKRTEAIRALAAFGRAGYGEEAAETILDVAREYDPYQSDGDPALKGLIKELNMTMTGNRHVLPATAWLDRLLRRVKHAGDKEQKDRWRNWLDSSLRYLSTHDSDVQDRLLQMLADDSLQLDSYQRLAVVQTLVRGDPDLKNEKIFQVVQKRLQADPPDALLLFETQFRHLDRLPEQIDLLFHDDPELRTTAQQALERMMNNQSTAKMFEALIEVLDDPERSPGHARAIELIEVVAPRLNGGPGAEMRQPVIDHLTRVVLEGDEQLMRPALKAIGAIAKAPEQDVANRFLRTNEYKMSDERRLFLRSVQEDIGGDGQF